MQTSVFLAKLIGPTMLLLGLAVMLNQEKFRQIAREFMNGGALLLLNGVVTFVAGLAVVLTHNDWSVGWPLIITVLGWAMLFAGVMRTLLPGQISSMGEKMLEQQWVFPAATAVYLVLGAFLTYQGFFA